LDPSRLQLWPGRLQLLGPEALDAGFVNQPVLDFASLGCHL
jgi:hypothetical protein